MSRRARAGLVTAVASASAPRVVAREPAGHAVRRARSRWVVAVFRTRPSARRRRWMRERWRALAGEPP